ncbi:butyrophilin subfamily 1 member A1 [Zeugodacus cucurbitae]|uniref:Butyrophilin subfamily 2 member A1 n=2 Tax=Zeugodacus cucurbitae TaxID=28588 RepID=A0A0A1XA19_ZEUCU|nr:butyrophilin subfamily 1 member A1 [Zeugodacus cucurbitae]
MNWLLVSFITVLTVALHKEIYCLVLTEIEGPSLVVIDDENVDPIPMNCHFKVEEASNSLVVKWSKDNKVLFQYIKGHGANVIPDFKGVVESLSSDPNDEESGIRLLNPTIETSGTYRCNIQTDKKTISMDKELHIIDIQNYTHTLKHNRIQNETHLECQIWNVYPKPTLVIQTWDGEQIQIISSDANMLNDGKFQVNATAVIRTDDENIEEYKCVSIFDGLLFNLTTNIISGSMSFSRPEWSHLLLTGFIALVTYLNI